MPFTDGQVPAVPVEPPQPDSDPCGDYVIVESGAYENRHVVGVFRTEQGAVEAIKTHIYGPPYEVAWSEKRSDSGDLTLIGEFEAVDGYSTRHTAYFDFEHGTFGDDPEPRV